MDSQLCSWRAVCCARPRLLGRAALNDGSPGCESIFAVVTVAEPAGATQQSAPSRTRRALLEGNAVDTTAAAA